MKPHIFAIAAAGILLSIGTAYAYHPLDRTMRGTLEQEQRDWIELEHVQQGAFRGRPSAAIAPRAARAQARPARRAGEYAVPPYLTEHHTR